MMVFIVLGLMLRLVSDLVFLVMILLECSWVSWFWVSRLGMKGRMVVILDISVMILLIVKGSGIRKCGCVVFLSVNFISFL